MGSSWLDQEQTGDQVMTFTGRRMPCTVQQTGLCPVGPACVGEGEGESCTLQNVPEARKHWSQCVTQEEAANMMVFVRLW